MIRYIFLSSVALACALPLAANGQATEIKFSALFSAGNMGSDIIIQVPDNGILVFDAGGPYRLESKNLIIRAKKARLDTSVVIEAFSADNIAPGTDGTPATPQQTNAEVVGTAGTKGAVGKTGASSGIAVLDLESIQRAEGAVLTVVMRGQTGGQGQMGGQGGKGGNGNSGRNAESDFPSCSRPCPDRGRTGAKGGSAGPGGDGGVGGAGGTIHRSTALQKYIDAGFIKLEANGGSGGKPGQQGLPGFGGNGGPRGSGGNCECKDVPGPGANGLDGDSAAGGSSLPGPNGPSGSVVSL